VIPEGAATYLLATPPANAAASYRHLDIFNAAGSGAAIVVVGLWAVPAFDVAVTGLVGVRLDVSRTSSAGTGGTAAGYRAATMTAPNVNPVDTRYPGLPAGITARQGATGGAAVDDWLFPSYVSTEETAPGTHLMQGINLLPDPKGGGVPLTINTGEGLLVQQGSVASVGSLSILLEFGIVQATTP
jgi:hypothetical protein